MEKGGIIAPIHAAVAERPYACRVADNLDQWPRAGQALLAELAAARGRIALVAADTPSDSDWLVVRLRDDLHLTVARRQPQRTRSCPGRWTPRPHREGVPSDLD
jgi:hypothetical protein